MEEGVRIQPADAFDVSVRKQILAFEQGGAFRKEHGGADETFFHGIVEFAVGLQNAFVRVDGVAAGRKAGHETGVRNGDEFIHAFAAQIAFQDIDGQMMTVRDGHDGHVVFRKTCPDGIVMAVDEIRQTVAEMLQEKVLTIGENIQIRRFERMEGACVAYVHAGGKIGVLVNFNTDVADKDEFVTCGKDVAMQIAALSTPYLTKADVPADVIEHEKEVMRQQVINEGKPAAIADKIVMGKINKYYKENCLVDQEFVKDNKMTVSQYVNSVAKQLGGSIEITKFVRFEKGEGIEKRQDDFAAEVASMVK